MTVCRHTSAVEQVHFQRFIRLNRWLISVQRSSYQNIQAKELADAKRVRAFLAHQDAVTLLSGKQSSASLIAFVHDRIHPHDIENFLAKRHVVIRAGHMCAQNAVRKMGYYAINRISFGLAVTDEDFEALCHALQQCFEEASG